MSALVACLNIAMIVTSAKSFRLVHLCYVQIQVVIAAFIVHYCTEYQKEYIIRASMYWNRLRMPFKVICILVFAWLATKSYLIRLLVVGGLSYRGVKMITLLPKRHTTRSILSTQKGPKSHGKIVSHENGVQSSKWMDSLVGSLTPTQVAPVAVILNSLHSIGSAILSSAKSKVSSTFDSFPATPAVTKRLFRTSLGSGSSGSNRNNTPAAGTDGTSDSPSESLSSTSAGAVTTSQKNASVNSILRDTAAVGSGGLRQRVRHGSADGSVVPSSSSSSSRGVRFDVAVIDDDDDHDNRDRDVSIGVKAVYPPTPANLRRPAVTMADPTSDSSPYSPQPQQRQQHRQPTPRPATYHPPTPYARSGADSSNRGNWTDPSNDDRSLHSSGGRSVDRSTDRVSFSPPQTQWSSDRGQTEGQQRGKGQTPYRSRPALHISTSSQDHDHDSHDMDVGGDEAQRGSEREQLDLDPGSYMDDPSPSSSSSAFSFSASEIQQRVVIHGTGTAVSHRGVSFSDNGSTGSIHASSASGGGRGAMIDTVVPRNKRAVQVVGWDDGNVVHPKVPHIEGEHQEGQENDRCGRNHHHDHDKENGDRYDRTRRGSGGSTPSAAMELLQSAQRQGLGHGQGKSSSSPYPRSALKRIRDALGGLGGMTVLQHDPLID